MGSSEKFCIVLIGEFFQWWWLDSCNRFMFLLASIKEMLSNAIYLIIEEYVLQEEQLRSFVECGPEQLIHFGVSSQGDSFDDEWSLEHVRHFSIT